MECWSDITRNNMRALENYNEHFFTVFCCFINQMINHLNEKIIWRSLDLHYVFSFTIHVEVVFILVLAFTQFYWFVLIKLIAVGTIGGSRSENVIVNSIFIFHYFIKAVFIQQTKKNCGRRFCWLVWPAVFNYLQQNTLKNCNYNWFL